MNTNVAEQKFDKDALVHIESLSGLSPELLEEALSQSKIERLPPGRNIFQEGDVDNRAVFLLAGQLALVSSDQPTTTIKAGEGAASLAVADHQPRQVSALATTSVTIMSIETAFLNQLLNQNNQNSPQAVDVTDTVTTDDADEASDASDASDTSDTSDISEASETSETNNYGAIEWLLNTQAMNLLPDPFPQVLKGKLVEMPVKAGEVVIHEGSTPEFYFILVQGRCRVTKHNRSGSEKIVEELTSGCAFAEELLIANHKHDQRYTMLEDGLLLRLTRGEFLSLLVKPFTRMVTFDDALSMQMEGAVLLDVRSPLEFMKKNIIGSVNLPLPMLWETACVLEKENDYIICSDSSMYSTVAAFLLARNGLNAHVMNKRMRYVRKKKLMSGQAIPHYK